MGTSTSNLPGSYLTRPPAGEMAVAPWLALLVTAAAGFVPQHMAGRQVACIGCGGAARAAPPPLVRARPLSMQDQPEEESETLEAVKIASTFFGASAVGYSGMVALGLDEVLAGNLVLLALVAYGAYLLFFDGGVTQNALEKQALAALANEESEMCEGAPKLPLDGYPAASLITDPSPASAHLDTHGLLRVNGALSEEASEAVLALVNAELEAQRQAAKDNLAAESANFGEILARENRWDLKLKLAPEVSAALSEVMTCGTQDLLRQKLGGDAELFELGALVSDPGSPPQPLHPDTPCRPDESGAAVLTSFIALQEVDAAMGPTMMLAGTHTVEAHEQFNDPADGGRAKATLIRTTPNAKAVMNRGDVTMIDSRLVHCGSGNDSSKRRVLLYVSFKRKGARTAPGTILYELKNKYTLDSVPFGDAGRKAEGAAV